MADAKDIESGLVRSGDVMTKRKLLDPMIAAQALVRRAVSVTMNPHDFADIVGLELKAW